MVEPPPGRLPGAPKIITNADNNANKDNNNNKGNDDKILTSTTQHQQAIVDKIEANLTAAFSKILSTIARTITQQTRACHVVQSQKDKLDFNHIIGILGAWNI